MPLVTDSTLSRQLSRLDLTEDKVPSKADWQKLLKYLDSHYKHVDDDRDMMARSLEISTEEMARIRESISGERDELRDTMTLFQTALDDFAAACRATRSSGGEDTTAITGARKRFNMSILSLLASAENSSDEYRELLSALRRSFVEVFEEVMTMVNPDMAVTDEVIALHYALIAPLYDEKKEGLHISTICDQYNRIGGDLWMTRRLPSGQDLICIGDATGHGATAGFFSGIVAASLTTWLDSKRVVDLEELYRYLNRLVEEKGGGTMFMTWCGLIIEEDRRSVSVINAGHSFPILCRDGSSRAMVIQGNPLGTPGDSPVKIGRVDLKSRDKLVLYTDGLTETRNDMLEEYGERRLRKLIDEYGSMSPGELAEVIRDDVHRYRENTSMTDDATVVVAAIR